MKEALKLALEALESAEIDGNCEYGATEIIRKALAQPPLPVQPDHIVDANKMAQPAQEPPSEWAGIKAILDEYGLQAIDFVADWKAQQELVFDCPRCGHVCSQRPWVGLTDEETIDLAVKVGARLDLPPATKMQLQQQFIDALRKPDSLWMLFARDIEAKLKEKNT
jgi:hypothetical protein